MARETETQRRERYGGLQRAAEDALSELLKSDTTPAAVRASLIRTALELSGAIGPGRRAEAPLDAPDFDASSMSAEDIDAEIARLGVV